MAGSWPANGSSRPIEGTSPILSFASGMARGMSTLRGWRIEPIELRRERRFVGV